MSVDEWIGSVGVAFLLLAFALSLAGILDQRSRSYAALNLVGATVAAYASWRIDFFPFVVLEGIWALVALAALIRPGPPAAAASPRP